MSLQQTIEQAFEKRNEYSPSTMPQDVRDAINQVLEQLDNGTLRVAEKRMANGSSISGQKKPFCSLFA